MVFNHPRGTQTIKTTKTHLKNPFLDPLGHLGVFRGSRAQNAHFALGVTISRYRVRIGPNGPGAFLTSFDPLFNMKLSLGPNSPPFLRYRGSLFWGYRREYLVDTDT